MKRTQSLAAALAAACIAAGGVTSSSAAALDPLTDPLLDVGKVEARLRSLGLNPLQILEVTTFLTHDRAKQGETLRAAGLTDPGGDLSDSYVSDYILGQYMLKNGVNPAKAKLLQLSSGKLDPKAAIALVQSLKGQIPVSASEIEQQMEAGGLTREKATSRAKLQRVAMLARPYLAKLFPTLSTVHVDAEATKVVVSTAGSVDEVKRLLGNRLGGLPMEARTARLSRTSLNELAAAVQAEVLADMPGAKVTIATDPLNSVVKVRANDAETDKRLRASPKAQERVKKGDAVVEAPRAIGPTAIIGGHPTEYGFCTWGFAAAKGADKFLVTAGHCNNAADYGPWIQTTLVESLVHGTTDVSQHGVDPFFYNQFDNFVERKDTAGNPLPDHEITSRTGYYSTDYADVVCHTGRITGHSCGYVTSLFVGPWWVPSSGRFVQVESPTMNNQQGDSGGPWYYGNSAFGIHAGGWEGYGSTSLWGLGVYGAIDFAEQQADFYVLTK